MARTFDSNIETLNDLYSLLAQRKDVDEAISEALQESGYLDLWRLETEAYPWRYDSEIIKTMSAPKQMVALREYCLGTVREAYSGGIRFAVNLVQLQALHDQYPRRSFGLEVELYRTLVRNDEARREVAYGWLLERYPDDLKLNMEQIEPHSEYWYSIIDRVEPRLGVLSRHAVAAAKSVEACSSCGDQPSLDYRLVNGAEVMPGVPSLRLCDDCIKIHRDMHNVLVPFLR